MAYDAARRTTILFGGNNGAYLNDMWTYDGTAWRQLTPATLPRPRAQHAMAYDPLRQRIVMVGGTDGTPLTDAWEWDGTSWTQVATSVPGAGAGGTATYDPLLGASSTTSAP